MTKRRTTVTRITAVTSVRLTTAQLKILSTQLPPEISVSAVVRALLQAYLEGKIPQANNIILLEVARARNAKKQYQFKPRENEDGTRAGSERLSA